MALILRAKSDNVIDWKLLSKNSRHVVLNGELSNLRIVILLPAMPQRQ
jgi:hypothetical protein